MQYLLDTHTFLWFLEGSDYLPQKVRSEITDGSNSCFLSIASLWEIAIKLRIKKLKLQFQFDKFPDLLDENDIELLPLTFDHVYKLLSLDLHHRDPFDNILIAQGIAEDLTIITKDENFSRYNARIFWG